MKMRIEKKMAFCFLESHKEKVGINPAFSHTTGITTSELFE